MNDNNNLNLDMIPLRTDSPKEKDLEKTLSGKTIKRIYLRIILLIAL